MLRPAAAASTCAGDAVDLALHQRDDVPVAAVLAQRGERLPQRQVRLVRHGHRGVGRGERPAGQVDRGRRRPGQLRRLGGLGRAGPLLAEHPPHRGVDPGQPGLERPAGVTASHTAGTRRATNAGAKLKKVAVTTSGPTGAQRGRRQAK